MAKVILDAGHGGRDTGDMLDGRSEKNDNLKLAMMVGSILESKGFQVAYTRTDDSYLSQSERVAIANKIGGDLLVSIHRLYGMGYTPGLSLDFFVLNESGLALEAANNIGRKLSQLDYRTYGIIVRTDIPIISDVNMPSLMIGIGHMQSPYENLYFDVNLNGIAQAIAEGIEVTFQNNQGEEVLPMSMLNNSEPECPGCKQPMESNNYKYRVQVGLFRNYNNAMNLQLQLMAMGLPVDITRQGELYAVQIGDYCTLDAAVELDRFLRLNGFDTLLVAV